MHPRIASRRRNIADPPTIVTGVEEHSDALSATREAIWEKRRQKDSSYRPPQLVPPPASQLYLNTASYFDPLREEQGAKVKVGSVMILKVEVRLLKI